MAETGIDTLTLAEGPEGAVLADSLQSDTGLHLNYGIVLERPAAEAMAPAGSTGNGMSWILTGMFLILVFACVRYKKNSRFFSLMLNDIMEVRERHNAFDDTLREKSFVWLLNILWCGAAGMLLYGLIANPAPGALISPHGIRMMCVCMGIGGAYTLFLALSYIVLGTLFSDSGKASMWVKGYLSTQGLEGVLMFPVAMLALCVPGLWGSMVVIGAIIFIIAKILFIYKSFCIFFTEISSWVLFLYYLCSLEIVPMILAYVLARHWCLVS